MSLYFYEGTGGYEGDPEMAGEDKPQLYGNMKSIRPVCICREKYIYQVHFERIDKINAVYHDGIAIEQAGIYDLDYEYDDLFSQVLDAWAGLYGAMGDVPKMFMADNAHGAFRLNFRPSGLITCDVSGSNTYTRPPLDVG